LLNHSVTKNEGVDVQDGAHWGIIRHGWLKVEACLQAARQQEGGWLWMLDMDLLLMNLSIPLQSITRNAPRDKHIIVVTECEINSGSMLFRNSELGRTALQRMLDTYLIMRITWNPRLYEQVALWALQSRDPKGFDSLLQGVKASVMNGRPPNYGDCSKTIEWKRGDLVLHFAGGDNSSHKITEMEKYLSNVDFLPDQINLQTKWQSAVEAYWKVKQP